MSNVELYYDFLTSLSGFRLLRQMVRPSSFERGSNFLEDVSRLWRKRLAILVHSYRHLIARIDADEDHNVVRAFKTETSSLIRQRVAAVLANVDKTVAFQFIRNHALNRQG